MTLGRTPQVLTETLHALTQGRRRELAKLGNQVQRDTGTTALQMPEHHSKILKLWRLAQCWLRTNHLPYELYEPLPRKPEALSQHRFINPAQKMRREAEEPGEFLDKN